MASVWVKIVSSWLVLLLYIWILIAPLVLTDRQLQSSDGEVTIVESKRDVKLKALFFSPRQFASQASQMVNSFKQPIRTGVSYPRLFIHFSACLFASLTMIIGSIMRSNHLLTIINEKIDIGYFNWCSADECHVISEWCAENTTTLDAKMKYTFCSTEYKIAIALDCTSLIISIWIAFVFLACFSAWLLAYVRTWGKHDIHDDKDDVRSLNDPNLEPVKPPSWTRYFHFYILYLYSIILDLSSFSGYSHSLDTYQSPKKI